MNIVDLDAYMRAYNAKFDFGPDGPLGNKHKHVSRIPCSALYDFCNAFPTLLHAWLFLVLQAVGMPEEIRWAIWWLYSMITAYSSGTGDGSFLFNVLGGVKTGCPLSSLLFLLGVNPVVDMFIMMSDGPKLSATRICADDIGSALRSLHSIKIHACIFSVAARACGLHLKHVKCVIIISGCVLTQELVQAIRSWLRVHVPEFAEFAIATSGKYLGWFLGNESVQLSFQGPFEKFNSRVQEVVDGNAPAPLAIMRYNQRAVPVLSYVSQFASPFSHFDVADKEQNAIHRILRLPPRSMSRKLMHSIGFCSVIEPRPLRAYSLGIMFRFAASEKQHLQVLARDVSLLCGTDIAVMESCRKVPVGNLDSTPILQNLLDALEFRGPASSILLGIQDNADFAWLDKRQSSVPFLRKDKVQSAVIQVLRPRERHSNLEKMLRVKLAVTLGFDHAHLIPLPPGWCLAVYSMLQHCKICTRMCWLKIVVGGWTTTHRMHEPHLWNCMFGCEGHEDVQAHYMCCPILWQLANETIPGEDSSQVLDRLCLNGASMNKLRRLSIAHGIYHACKNDAQCISDGFPASTDMVLRRAQGFARSCFQLSG